MKGQQQVTEYDFRQERFKNADPNDYEFRADGEIVRKDRWEMGLRNVGRILGVGHYQGFEIDDVIKAVRHLKEQQIEDELITEIKAFFSTYEEKQFIPDAFLIRDLWIDDWERLKQEGATKHLPEHVIKTVDYILALRMHEDDESVEAPVNPNQGQMPVYRCHKLVRAFEIGEIEGNLIYPVDKELCKPVEVTDRFIDSHPLNEPGYFVLYADGYVSYSPKKAFEEGYRETLLFDDQGS